MVRQEMAAHKETQSCLVFFTPTALKLCTMKKAMLATNFASNFNSFSGYYTSADFNINIVVILPSKSVFLTAYTVEGKSNYLYNQCSKYLSKTTFLGVL